MKAVRENYHTAGQPFAHGNTRADHEDDRATADVVAPRGWAMSKGFYVPPAALF